MAVTFNHRHLHQIQLTNLGSSCREVRVFLDSLFFEFKEQDFLQLESLKTYHLELEIGPNDRERTRLLVSFTDGLGNQQVLEFGVDIEPREVVFSTREEENPPA